AVAGSLAGWPGTTGSFIPAAEVAEDGEDAVITLELPGVDVAKDVTVEVNGDQLMVHGERRDERSEQRNGRSLREVRYGSFRRAFTLPSHVTAEAVSAGYEAGVLSVRVAGAYAAAEGARRIPVATGPDPVAVGTGASAEGGTGASAEDAGAEKT